MNRLATMLVAIAAFILCSTAIGDDDDIREWRDHARPFTFLFGNHIDTHQETRLKKSGDLAGYFYIYWTGEFTDDGEPIAEHCTEPEHYAAGCFAGWKIKAKPCIEEVNACRAMVLYHYHDHPVWMIGPWVDKSGGLRGTRSMIPEPGSYTHLHWLTEGTEHKGVFLPSSLEAVERLFGVDIYVPPGCNVDMASELTSGDVCPGYFLQIKAVEEFVFRHGGELIPVRPGIDNRSHLNIVTSYRSLPEGVLPGDYAETGDGGGEH